MNLDEMLQESLRFMEQSIYAGKFTVPNDFIDINHAVIDVEFWESTPEEIARGNKVNAPREVLPYWKDGIRPTVDTRAVRFYRQWPTH